MPQTPDPDSSTRPTQQDVARAAGVSLATVDRVFNLRSNVRTDTARRVAEAARRIGFHASGVIERHVRADRPRHRFGFLLLREGAAFYGGLAEALAQAAANFGEADVVTRIERLDNLEPGHAARALLALGAQVDALAVVAADHVQVHAAVATLRSRGVPVVALISDLAAPARAGYVGLDNRKTGRTAAWFITRMARRPGPLALCLGSNRFQCQELCEMSFRSYVRELGGEWEVLAPRMTLENEGYAYETTLDLLQAQPELCGLYLAGGGALGVLQALRAFRERGLPTPVSICHDLTPVTRQALQEGILHAVLSHPVPEMARATIELLAQALRDPMEGPDPAATGVGVGVHADLLTQRLVQRWVPLQVDTPENL